MTIAWDSCSTVRTESAFGKTLLMLKPYVTCTIEFQLNCANSSSPNTA